MQEYNLKEWKEKFNNKEFEDKDVDVQIKAGWYDWFCNNSALSGKTRKLGRIIKKLNDCDKVYVWFKNNCPMVGPLYDDFRIADIRQGNTLYTTTVDDKREDNKYNIYGIDNGFEKPLLTTNDVKEVVDFLNSRINVIEKVV